MEGVDLYISALAMGLLGSLHCLGMCGPIFLASAGFFEKPSQFVMPLVFHHSGKLISYMALGLIMGSIGKAMSLVIFQNQLMIVCGLILLVYASLSFLHWTGLNWLNRWVEVKMGAALKNRKWGGWMLGLVNGLVPCGLVYAAAMGSVATHSLSGGVIFMFFFGLGTIPSLTLAGFSRWVLPFGKIRNSRLWRQIPTVILGFWLLLKGLGLGIPFVSPDINSHKHEKNCCEQPGIRTMPHH